MKNLSDDWWDGYIGQPRVILNDFRGQIKYEDLLCLVDKWPHTVKQRNREPVPFLAREFIVTSSLHPALLYKQLKHEDSIDQLLRRFELKKLSDVYVPEISDQRWSEGNTGTSDHPAEFEPSTDF